MNCRESFYKEAFQQQVFWPTIKALTISIHLPQLNKTCNNGVHVLDVSLYATEKLTTTYQAYKYLTMLFFTSYAYRCENEYNTVNIINVFLRYLIVF
jgi:hypothetical protein